jgi:SAM-dependent methyltransferase
MSTKTIQGKLWSIAPENWSIHFEPYFLPIYRKVLEQINITENTMLLDAGCGSGLFTALAARTGAQVTGIDAASGLLDIARERNPGVTFLEEDLEALPFADNTFDVVTGFNSFQYAGNFENALNEAKRVLKPGGKLIAVIWDKPEMSDGTEILKAISTLLPPPLPGTPGPFALSEDGKVETILEGIGLKKISNVKVSCPFLYHSLNNAVKSFMGTGPAAAALNQHPEVLVEGVIADAFAKFYLANGMYFLMNSFLLFVAEK